jgi:uncharacterized protein (DUF2252 family)
MFHLLIRAKRVPAEPAEITIPKMKRCPPMKVSKLPRKKDRAQILISCRAHKMAGSANAYVRGSTVKFYEWLEAQKRHSLPEGPPVWICGDCHSGNLGPVADAKGRVEIQIRDLDQTVIGNPTHDLIRLGLSLAMAARGSDLPGVTTATMLEQMIGGYAQGLSKKLDESEDRPEAVSVALKSAGRRSWKQLAQERIEDSKPTIPLGKSFWPLEPIERSEIKKLFEQENVRELATMLRARNVLGPCRQTGNENGSSLRTLRTFGTLCCRAPWLAEGGGFGGQ